MNELEHLSDTLHRSFEGDAWHGPALSEILAGISPERASRRIGEAHTIWELTEHITAWLDIVRRRLEGERLTDEDIGWGDNWPKPPDSTEQNWLDTVNRTQRAAGRLADSVLKFGTEKLDQTVPGKDYSFAVMLHGAAQHVLYHAGQIAILKKFD